MLLSNFKQMKMQTVKIYDLNQNIIKLELLGLEEYIPNVEELNILIKYLNFFIGLMIGRIEPTNNKRRKFISIIKNNRTPEDQYQFVFTKFLDWYDTMEKNEKFKDFLDVRDKKIEKFKKTRDKKIKTFVRSESEKDNKTYTRPFTSNKIPVHIINRESRPILEPSDIECIKCGDKIAQGRVDFFKETENVIVNTCVECADNSVQYVEQIPDRYPQPPKKFDKCPKCGNPSVVRQNMVDKSYFLACNSFPSCWWTHKYK